ncbi:hypothetical protein P053_02061 [Brucella abortus 01-4165]|nr:MATE efflux family protein [Brucella abortus A13334]AIJ53434.1 putative multidrug resistance norM domain protein [Brucella abortus]AIJ60044.1 putative multidrug resistance norM domain protein [Brucella abortus bv. 9 str. C68]AIJ64233.1 putative multidrug resistance norM domain protein [Brucella abortus bv. 6 str. 870]AIJ92678.1 putative multidrug resistance norM domain protein [Brucella abortus bv. 2 str. 86/8/59]ALF30517.1 multidrug transporter MatE [Brucella abortus 104M]AOG43128.1 multi
MDGTFDAGFREPTISKANRWGREMVVALKLGWPLIFTNLS